MYRAESVTDISRRIGGAFETEMPDSRSSVWPSNLAIIKKVLAQTFRGMELRLEWLHRQRFTSLAEKEFLDLHATDAGLARLPALYASGFVQIITVPETVIPAGLQMTHGDMTYETVAEVTATTTLTAVQIQAIDPGPEGNIDPGGTLTLTEENEDLGLITVASTGIVGGAEVESDDSLRERILYTKRNPPMGGSPSEYIQWARQKPGVTRVWVQRATPNPGQVTIYFAMDSIYSDGIPTAADADDLKALLEEFAPANADIIVSVPTPLPVNVTTSNLRPDTAATREAVYEELYAMFLRRAEPGEIFARDWIAEAISSVPGWRRHRTDAPADDVTPSTSDELPVLGTLTFVPDSPYY